MIFGGRSGEHEVSLRSARAIIDAMDRGKYEVLPVAITKEGRWLSPRESVNLPLEEMISMGEEQSVSLSGDPSRRGLQRLEEQSERKTIESLDVIFPALHGPFGEDGTIQGLLEMAGLPYVGCGVLSSSCGMDKVVMKSLFREAGLPICRHIWFLRADWERDAAGIVRRVEGEIGFPCFIKPANLGSSVGISKAKDATALEEAINLAARYDRKLIVEEGLDVREIECAVLGNDAPEASLPGEYVSQESLFLDYTEKYSSTGHVEFVVPAPIPRSLAERITKMSVEAFRAIDGAGLARVDFFLRRDTDELLINELNTMPGFTQVSGYPKMWAASGLPFPQLVDRLIELAIERHKDKERNETSI